MFLRTITTRYFRLHLLRLILDLRHALAHQHLVLKLLARRTICSL